MKLAIISDGFLHIGGAEKVFLEIVKLYPNADLYVPIINKTLKQEIEKRTKGEIYTTFISQIPFFYKQASLLKPLLIFYWEKLNLAKYDLVITSSHSFNSKLVNASQKTIHISYVHTPPRYLSKHFSEMNIIKNPLINFLSNPLIKWLKNKDFQSGLKPDILIANSKNVQSRIKQTYDRKSLLIYPPVKISPLISKKNKDKYFLCFSRLVKQKGIDLAVRSCTKLNVPLVIVGTGPELNNLKKIAGPTITFKGFLKDNELEKIFMHTKAMINCAIEEDFGMVTVEAASRGIPIVAFKSGGLTETVIENKTGIFFNQHTVKSLSTALKKFEKMTFSERDCHKFAEKFSTDVFRKKIDRVVKFYSQE